MRILGVLVICALPPSPDPLIRRKKRRRGHAGSAVAQGSAERGDGGDSAHQLFGDAAFRQGLLSQQVRDALKTLSRSAGSSAIVKLRAFVAGSGDLRRVQAIVSETFTDKHRPLPALSVVQVGGLPLEGAQVVLEATLSGKKDLNPNGLVFLAGQQASSPRPLEPVAP